MRIIPRSRQSVYLLVATVVWAIAFCAYYFIWISQQQARLTASAFRMLAVTSDQIKSKLDNYVRVLDKVGKQGFDTAGEADVPQKFERNWAPIPQLNYALCPLEKKLTEVSLSITAQKTRFIVPVKGLFEKKTPDGQYNHMCAEQPLQETVGAFFNQLPDDLFDEILLSDAAGLVLYQKTNTGARVVNLTHLLAQEAASGGKDSSSANTTSQRVATFKAESFVNSFESSVANRKYRVFATPVPVERLGKDLIVCGLVLSDRFRSQTVAIPFVWFILGVFLVVSLSWPILKLKSQAERLRPHQVFYLQLLSLFGAFLATLLILHATYFLPYGDIDHKLRELADRIDGNIASELTRGLETVESIQSSGELRADADLLSPVPPNVNALDFCTQPSPPPPIEKKRTKLLETNKLAYPWYPYLDSIFWVDDRGYQRVKWSVKDSTTPSTPVCDPAAYPFFQEVREGRLWTLDVAEHGSFQLTIHPVYSPNTGEYFAAVAQPALRGPLRVVTLVTPMISLARPVMPPGFGFAIVDNLGKVLFHSVPQKNGTENFFRECDNDVTLRSAVLAQSGKHVTANYMGVRQRLYVTPLKRIRNSSWSLIVFHDLTPSRTTHLEAFLMFLVLAAFYAAVLLPLAALLIGLKFLLARMSKHTATDPIRQFRPSPQNANAHWFLVFAYLLVLVPFVLAIQTASPGGTLASIFMFPGLAIVILLSSEYLSERARTLPKIAGPAALDRFTMPDWKTGYYLASALLAAIIAIIPCMALFRVSFDYARKLFVKQDQMTLARTLQAREDRAYSAFRDVPLAGEAQEPSGRGVAQVRRLFLERRLQETLDRYDTVFLNLNPRVSVNDRPDEDSATLVLRTLTSYLPLEAAAGPRQLWHGASTDGSWNWRLEGPERIRLERRDGRIQVQSYLPGLWRFNFWAWAGAFAVFGLVFFWIRWAAGKAFLLEVETCTPWDDVAFVEGRNVIASGLPFSGKSDFLRKYEGRTQVIDIVMAQRTGRWNPPLDVHPFVVLDHFDYRMDDREINACKLKLLETLVFFNGSGKTIIILTTIDPIFYLFEQPVDSDGKVTDPGAPELSRWARVFQSFSNARLPSSGKLPGNIEAYHRALWATCTATEKLVLFQLAMDGWMNPRNEFAIRHLCERGIITREATEFRFVQEKFEEFVEATCGSTEAARWEKVAAGGAWRAMRPALALFGLGLLVVGLYPWISSLGLGWATGLVGAAPAVPALLKVASEFRKGAGSGGVSA